MHVIKKYANRKLYDTTDKRYISLERISELIDEGVDVKIIDSKTGEDLTSQTVSQILVRDRSIPTNILVQLLKTGKGTINFARNRVSDLQEALASFGEEADKLISRVVKESDLSESEGGKLKKELSGQIEKVREWLKDNVDNRVNEVLDRMNVASKDQLAEMRNEIASLKRKVNQVEKILGSGKKTTAKGKAKE